MMALTSIFGLLGQKAQMVIYIYGLSLKRQARSIIGSIMSLVSLLFQGSLGIIYVLEHDV